MNFQRDNFISTVQRLAEKDEDIVFLSADFGAPALDHFIRDLPEQFFHLGISEQNLIDVAIGMSLKGKKVITYAMAPFISLRCAEQHKLAAMMKLPIINIIAGVGLGYANAGPTHYATEDYGLAVNFIGSTIYTISDAPMAGECAKHLLANPTFSFVRMDRAPGPDLAEISGADFARGHRSFFNGTDACVISHGYPLMKIITALRDNPELASRVTVIDLFKSKPFGNQFLKDIQSFDRILTVDEQIASSSLGRNLLPTLVQGRDSSKVRNMALTEEFMFANSGRDGLLDEAGIGTNAVLAQISELIAS